jgi:transposase
MTKDEELEQLRQENLALREANQTLRAGLLEAIQAIDEKLKRVKELEGVITSQQERIKTLEGQLTKDSHNSNLPPSSDRFVRVPKSLRQKSGRKPGGQKGHRGHHLRQVERPDQVLIHPVMCCESCQRDLSNQPAELAERRQVIDLPVKRLWVTEHRVEEKQCPVCFHLTRAPFPTTVSAPAQYGPSIQTVATYLVEGQSVPYARASQLLQELLGVQLSAGSIATFVKTCHRQLAEVETDLKAALVKAKVIHQDETGLRVGKEGWWGHVCLRYGEPYPYHPKKGSGSVLHIITSTGILFYMS